MNFPLEKVSKITCCTLTKRYGFSHHLKVSVGSLIVSGSKRTYTFRVSLNALPLQRPGTTYTGNACSKINVLCLPKDGFSYDLLFN